MCSAADECADELTGGPTSSAPQASAPLNPQEVEFEQDAIAEVRAIRQELSAGPASQGAQALSQVTAKRLHDIAIQIESLLERMGQTRRDLRSTAEWWQLAIESAGDGVWDWNTQTNVVHFTKQWKEMLGFSDDEVVDLYAEWETRVHPDDLPGILELLREHLAGGTPTYRSEQRLKCKDGSYKWILDRGRVVARAADGAPVRMVGTHTDISELKQTQQALQQREAYLQAILDNFPFIVWLKDPQGRFLAVNEAFAQSCGIPDAASLTGLTDFDIWPADLAEGYVADDQAVLSNGSNKHIEELISEQGTATWFETYKAPIWDKQHNLLGTVGFARDISERKRNAAERERLYEVIEQTADLVSSAATDGRLLYMNAAGRRMLGWEMDADISPKSIQDAHPDWAYRIVKETGLPIANASGVWQGENAVVDTAGREIPVSQVIMAHRAADGELLYYSTIMRDISGLKQAEQERSEIQRSLLHSQKLESLGILAGGIAHDFNNLLLAILGNLDLVQLELPQCAAVREPLREAINAVHKASDLTRQMLAYSGKGAFQLQKVDLADLILENMNLLRAAVGKTAQLKIEAAQGLPKVLADPRQLQQVLINLVSNASEAIGNAPGTIALSTGIMECDAHYLAQSRIEPQPDPGTYAYVDVADTGCGMDSTALARLFDPFFTTKFTGRGMGMAAVHGIVQGHRGAIMVESDLDFGTKVRILVPVHQPEVSVQQPAEMPVTTTGETMAVLVVDDESAVRRLCLRYFKRLGIQAYEAEDGEEAVQVFREHSDEITCLLLDLSMPRMDGVTALREIRQIRPNVPAVLCSGYSEHEAAQRFAGAGLEAFLQKPYNLEVLKKTLDRALNKQ